MKTYLSEFHSIAPRFQLSQEQTLQNLVEIRMRLTDQFSRTDAEKRIRRFGLAQSKIKFRGTEIPDYVLDLRNPEVNLQFFSNQEIPSLEKRMNLYLERTETIFGQLYPSGTEFPDHLVHVSCTGYTSPNAAQKLVSSQNPSQGSQTQVTNAYHMGCYAAMPALRVARGLSQTESRSKKFTKVHIVHNELCSLHFDPLTLEAEQIVVQSLFADGHIKYTLSSELPNLGFEIKALQEIIIPNSSDQMTWVPGSTHFKMHLAREVPNSISEQLKPFVSNLLNQAGIPHGDPKSEENICYAIHPGGPKIIEEVESILELPEGTALESHEILSAHGNMSSATLPHIWQKILENPNRKKGSFVVSLAFGPGLTLSGGVFQICGS